MHKWLLAGCLFSLLFTSTVYAHVSGAFGDFLVGIEDENTTEKLKKEMKETKEEIERLTPKVEKLEEEYGRKEEVAVTKLKFYNTVGLDTFMSFILESEGIVNILASQRIVEKNLEAYLQELNELYLDYMQVKVTKDALVGHEKLLNIIQDNLAAREEFFSENQGMTPFQLANLAVTDWAMNAGELLQANLQEDSQLINENMKVIATRKTKDSPYNLEEGQFNEYTTLDYHFRSDHIYVHYQKEDSDVILIGVITKDNEKTASLKFEAGFLNGILISDDLVSEIKGFKINYDNLNPNSKGFYVEQTNGSIVIQPIEKAIE